MNKEKHTIDTNEPFDHASMMKCLDIFADRYSIIGITSIGESILGRTLPLITVGEGKRAVLYVGAHHGMEWITSALLIRFLNELCELFLKNGSAYGYSIAHILKTRTLYIIPMLNPDGVDYQINGVAEDNVLRERLIAMNGGSEDFSHWQANARGVDLNRNYNSRFLEYKQTEEKANTGGGAPMKFAGVMPESEPEVGALCNFLRFDEKIKAVLTFHSQGEEIYYTCGNGKITPRSRSIGERLSKLTGYKLALPQKESAFCGLTDWCIDELGLPSFTIECGKGENPLPIKNLFLIYMHLREMLFTVPTII